MTIKRLYIAAPFFNAGQLTIVQFVEQAITEAGLSFYSPRLDGVLKDMTPAQRQASADKIFRANCANIVNSDAFLAVLNEHDTGTYWECGFAYAVRRYNMGRNSYRLFAYTTTKPALNVMLAQSFDHHACGDEEFKLLLRNYATDKPIVRVQQVPVT